jgi:hypothetical protein
MIQIPCLLFNSKIIVSRVALDIQKTANGLRVEQKEDGITQVIE